MSKGRQRGWEERRFKNTVGLVERLIEAQVRDLAKKVGVSFTRLEKDIGEGA